MTYNLHKYILNICDTRNELDHEQIDLNLIIQKMPMFYSLASKDKGIKYVSLNFYLI